MAGQPQRTLVDRWHFGVLPQLWERAVDVLQSRLQNLERTLGILHEAVEHPAPTADSTRTVCTVNTTINSGSQTDITGASTTYTPAVDGTLIVYASWLTECATFSAAADRFNHHLTVNGSASTVVAAGVYSAVSQRTTQAQVFFVPVVAGTVYTLKLTSRVAAGLSTYTVLAAQTTGFNLLFVPNLYVP